MAIPPKQRTDRVPGEIIQDEDIDGLASAINDIIDELSAIRALIGSGGGGTGDGDGGGDVVIDPLLEARVAAIEANYVRGTRWDVVNRRFADGGLVLHASPWDSSATTPPAPASDEDALWADA